jgi:hypothetical protein
VELLDYAEEMIPTLNDATARFAMLRYYKASENGDQRPPRPAGFSLLFAQRLPSERVEMLGNRPRPQDRPSHERVATDPKHLDQDINRIRQSVMWLPG